MKVLHKNNKKKWIWGTCSRAGTTTSSWRGYIKCQQPLGSPVLKSFSVKLRTKYTIPLSVPLQPRTAAQNHRTAPRRIAGCCHVAHFGSPRRNGTAFCQLLKRNKGWRTEQKQTCKLWWPVTLASILCVHKTSCPHSYTHNVLLYKMKFITCRGGRWEKGKVRWTISSQRGSHSTSSQSQQLPQVKLFLSYKYIGQVTTK